MKNLKYLLISTIVLVSGLVLVSCGHKVDFNKDFDLFTGGDFGTDETVRGSFKVPSKAKDNINVKWEVIEGNEYAYIGNNDEESGQQVISIILPDKPKDQDNPAKKEFKLKVTLSYGEQSKSAEFDYKLAYFDGVRRTISLADFYKDQAKFGEKDVFLFDQLKVIKVLGKSTLLADSTGHAVTVFNNTKSFKVGQVGKLTGVVKGYYHGAVQLKSEKQDSATFIPLTDKTVEFTPEFATIQSLQYKNITDGSLVANNPDLNTAKTIYAKLTLNKNDKNDITGIKLADPNNDKMTLTVSKYDSFDQYKNLDGKNVEITVYPITMVETSLACYLGMAKEATQPADLNDKASFINSLVDLKVPQITESGVVSKFELTGVEFTYAYDASATDEQKSVLNLETFEATVKPEKLIYVPVVVTAKKGDLTQKFIYEYAIGELQPVGVKQALVAENDGKNVKIEGYYTGTSYKTVYVQDMKTADTIAITLDNGKIKAEKFVLGEKVIVKGKLNVNDRTLQIIGDFVKDEKTKLAEADIIKNSKDYSADYYTSNHLYEFINLNGFTYTNDKGKETFKKGDITINAYKTLSKDDAKTFNGKVVNVKYYRVSQHRGNLQVVNDNGLSKVSLATEQ